MHKTQFPSTYQNTTAPKGTWGKHGCGALETQAKPKPPETTPIQGIYWETRKARTPDCCTGAQKQSPSKGISTASELRACHESSLRAARPCA
eukprot:590899-Rhodomonas_salina.1